MSEKTNYTQDELQRRMDARDSNASFAYLNKAVLDIQADASMLRKYVESLHVEMRDLRDGIINTQQWVKDNSEVTRQTRDILISFSVVASVAKWISVVALALGAFYAAMKGYFQK